MGFIPTLQGSSLRGQGGDWQLYLQAQGAAGMEGAWLAGAHWFCIAEPGAVGEKGTTLPSRGHWWGTLRGHELIGRLDELVLCLLIPKCSVVSQTGPGVEVGNPVFSMLKDYLCPVMFVWIVNFILKIHTCVCIYLLR